MLWESKWSHLCDALTRINNSTGKFHVSHACFPDARTSARNSVTAATLHNSHCNLMQTILSHRYLSSNCLFKLNLLPPLLLIPPAKNHCFKINLVIFLILPLKTSPCFNLLEYTYSSLYHTLCHCCATGEESSYPWRITPFLGWQYQKPKPSTPHWGSLSWQNLHFIHSWWCHLHVWHSLQYPSSSTHWHNDRSAPLPNPLTL